MEEYGFPVSALKSSFLLRPEGREAMPEAEKKTPQKEHQPGGVGDEIWSGDQSFVDELLNLADENCDAFPAGSFEMEDGPQKDGALEAFLLQSKEGNGEEDEKNRSCPPGSCFEESQSGKCSGSNSNYDFDFEFCPLNEQEEWLSQFMEDSLTKFPSSDACLAILKEPLIPACAYEEEGNRVEISANKSETAVPGKARSKRRPIRQFHLQNRQFSEPATTSSSTTTSTSSSSSSSFSSYILSTKPSNQELFCYFPKPLSKKMKRMAKPAPAASEPRRCSHCLVQRTPQWRAGPQGAKTLCNACGVRYKSGRLLPEYRPAGSPTFLANVHSNSHRKVLEMRQKKTSLPEPGLRAVQSF